VKQALYFSGNNQHELEKVLNHYSDDSLKYLAAEYLIKSMPYYSFQEVIPGFEMVFDSLALVPTGNDALRKSIYINLLDSVSGKGKKWPDETKYDIQEVSADFLIENIDLAFEAWHQIPDNKRANFDAFCHYILPYRNWDEPLEKGTRRYLNHKYQWVKDELHKGVPVKKVIDSVLSGFHYRYVGEVRDFYPSALSVRQFDRSRLGLCQDAVNYFTHVFRSVGIVCSNEYLPQWGTHHTNGHSWLYFQYGDEDFALDAEGDGLDVREKFNGESIPKVYRRTYAQVDPTSLFREGRDVTEFYRPVIDFELNISGQSIDTSLKYTVNVFHAMKKWAPVAELEWREVGPNQNSTLICHDLGVNTVYIAGRWDQGEVYPLSVPFLVNEEGDIHEFRPGKTLLDSVPLLRKYGLASPRNRAKSHWIKVLEGATIQGALDSTFANADTLYKFENFWSTHLRTFEAQPGLYHYGKAALLSGRVYKFVRFVPAQDGVYLAELAFYADGEKKLTGEIISRNIEAGKKDSALFDGNPLTYAGGTDFYVGYAFDRPEKISKISFQARNDDNHIRLGDEYELQYWDRKWRGLGRQIATDTILYYNNVPENALMLLKNHTRGSEEIPFRINDMKEQEWIGFYNY